MSAGLILGLFFGLIAIGVPIAYTMAFVSSLYFIFSGLPLNALIQRMANSANSITLLAVPTFIYAGCVMNNGGLTSSLFKAINSTSIGKVRGGLGHVNILASLVFAGMSGAALADIGGLGNIEIKAMTEAGYKKEDSVAITLASSSIGPIFPPSIPLLMYAMITQVSGVRILLAGIVPALVLVVTMMIEVWYFATKYDWPRGNVFGTFKERFRAISQGLPAFLAPVILLGGLFMGKFSPSELACVAVVYAAIVGATVYRGMDFKTLMATSREAIGSIGNMLFICAAATAFSFVLTVSHVPDLFKVFLTGVSSNWVVLILITNVILLIAGMIMDSGICILVFTPMLLPALVAAGMDPIQVGIVICLNVVIGLFTPPYGTGLFMASIMTGMPVMKVAKAMVPYYIPLIVTLLLVSLIPQLSLWIPTLVYG